MPSFWEKVEVDGLEMDLYASVPSGSGPFPAIVVAHPGQRRRGVHPEHCRPVG